MSSVPTFSIRLDDDDSTLLGDFRHFLAKHGLDISEVSRLVDEFASSTLPQLSRFRTLSRGGSMVDFARLFDTSRGQMKVELNTSPKTLFARLANIFGR